MARVRGIWACGTAAAVVLVAALVPLAGFNLGRLFSPGVADATAVPDSVAPAGPLRVSAAALDFGEVGVLREFAWTLPLENVSTQPVEVLEFSPSCRCTAFDPPRLRLAPGEKRDVRLVLDLAPQNDRELSAAVREFRVSIEPRLAEGLTQEPFELTGRVRNVWEAEPPLVRFPGEWIEGRPIAAQNVRVAAPGLARLEARCEPRLADVAAEPAGEGGFLLRIAPQADLGPGNHDFLIKLSGFDAAGDPLPEGAISGAVRVERELRLSPPTLAFGRVGGAGEEKTVSLGLRTAGALEAVRAEVEGDEFSIAPRPGLPQEFSVRLVRPAAGVQLRQIVFRARVAGREQELSAPLRVTYRGELGPQEAGAEEGGD